MTTTMSLLDVFRNNERGATLLAELERLGPPERPVVVPEATAISELLTTLGGPSDDFADVIAARSLIADNPEAVWLLERHVHFLQHYTGVINPDSGFIELPTDIGPLARFFFLYVYMSAFPDIRRYHRSLGIPDDDSIEILSDLGRNMLVNRKRTGESGLAAPWWCMLHFRGMIYQFGRLQFERVLLGEDMAASIQAAGFMAEPETTALSIHIPDFMGSFPPAAIDESIQRALRFFAHHFPNQDIRFGVCYSWLLDDQLPNHLSPSSNIVNFHQRFHLISQGERTNGSFATFIWGTQQIPDKPSANATTLERLVIAHQQAGGSWGSGAGWTELGASAN
ncbi:MAG: acyltransferase domain-containing protein [Thermomicrobiales bacterium]